MDGFEWNKVMMGVILALLVGKVSGKVADVLIAPDVYAKNAYVFAEAKEASPSSGAAASAEATLEPIEPLLASADPVAGQQIAKKCLMCHTLEKGGKNKVGPNMWGVVGAAFGHVEGFAYSSGVQEGHSKGRKWDYAALNAFLHKPKEYIKGTKMAFVGISKAKDRADLIAYLRTLSDNPIPLPQ